MCCNCLCGNAERELNDHRRYEMVTIYQDYDDEPEDVFLPLPADLAAEFYRLEMDSYEEDVQFYTQFLPQKAKVLELGCGTGRLATKIAAKDRPVFGIDISIDMLKIAWSKNHPHCSFICMDMVQPVFRSSFDVILIPYNTLNLLTSTEKIVSCLTGCRNLLYPGGKLLLQIFVPSQDLHQQEKKTFQFQSLDLPEGGRIIKEVLKKYVFKSQTIEVEERFRVRPTNNSEINRDWNVKYTIAGFTVDRWLSIFNKTGFKPASIYGRYDNQSYNPEATSCMLTHLSVQ